MKKVVLILLAFGIQLAMSQQIAYIQMDKILEKMPAFNEASVEIETQVKQWETELDNKYQSIESMYQEYVSSESLMPEDVKKSKQDAIFQAEAKVKTYKEEKFGPDGALSQLQSEKFDPLYEQITMSSEKVAKEIGYSYVFNKNGEEDWIYTNPDHDLTEKVIVDLGL